MRHLFNKTLANKKHLTFDQKDGCVARATTIIGNKWTPLLLRELAKGPMRFCEFEKALDCINPRTLSQRLDDLENFGVITKKSYAEKPPRIEYTLTKKGEDLLPILEQMAIWGTKYN